MKSEDKKEIAIIIAYTIIIICLLAIIFILLTKDDEPKETQKTENGGQTEETLAEENEAIDKAWATVDAVRIAYAQAQTESDPVALPYTVNFPKENNKGAEGVDWGNDENTGGAYGKGYVNDEEVKPTGALPEEGSVTIQDNFEIIAYKLKFGDYYCSTINENDKSTFDSNTMICSKDESDVEIVNYNH